MDFKVAYLLELFSFGKMYIHEQGTRLSAQGFSGQHS